MRDVFFRTPQFLKTARSISSPHLSVIKLIGPELEAPLNFQQQPSRQILFINFSLFSCWINPYYIYMAIHLPITILEFRNSLVTPTVNVLILVSHIEHPWVGHPYRMLKPPIWGSSGGRALSFRESQRIRALVPMACEISESIL
jgi:hypothetical protein